MTAKLKSCLQQRYAAWVARRIPPVDKITLNRRIIYVLPTRNGLFFLLSASLIFIAAINYAVSLAYALAFMMFSLFIVSVLYAFQNLNALALKGLPSLPVFCGEEMSYEVELSRANSRGRDALELNFPDHVASHVDLLKQDRERVKVFSRSHRRGYIKAPILRITTRYPLGICRAWSLVDLNMHCLVYPRPIPFAMEQFDQGHGGSEESAHIREGSEDFYGLRDYVPGDPLRQVAWKNVARGQGMHVKQFVDYSDSKVWLDWDMFYGFGVEERLSRLCYCVLQLSKAQQVFGLKIPGVEIAPDSGAAHRDKLLRALALYGVKA